MAESVKGTIYDGVRGGKVKVGTFTLDPASIAGNTEAETTLALAGVTSGDLVFVNPQSLDGYLVSKGARVTGSGEIGVTLANVGSTAVDGASITYDYIVFHAGNTA